MGYRLTRWLSGRALRVDVPVGRRRERWAVRRLCARLRERPADFHRLMAVTRIMCSSPDGWASRRAADTLAELSTDPSSCWDVLRCFTGEPEYHWGSAGRYCVLSPASVAFLVGPPPAGAACPYAPRSRLVAFLAAEQPPDRPSRMVAFHALDRPPDRPLLPSRERVARWFLDSTLEAVDDGVRASAAELLSTTDQPELLQALDDAFVAAAGRIRRPAPLVRGPVAAGPHDLWIDRLPTLLTAAAQANPYLPPPMDGVTPGNFTVHSGVLLAVLRGRLDLIDEYVRVRGVSGTVGALVDGAGFAAPETFTEGCRRALRGLGPGPAREELCRLAAYGHEEALAAVVDAGFVWGEDPAAFLSLTRTPSTPDSPRNTSIGSWPTDGASAHHGGVFDGGGGHGSGGHGSGYHGGHYGI